MKFLFGSGSSCSCVPFDSHLCSIVVVVAAAAATAAKVMLPRARHRNLYFLSTCNPLLRSWPVRAQHGVRKRYISRISDNRSSACVSFSPRKQNYRGVTCAVKNGRSPKTNGGGSPLRRLTTAIAVIFSSTDEPRQIFTAI